MYDFHIHSSWSDGALNEVEILEKVKEKGIKYFSLTDHDNIDGSKRIHEHEAFLKENGIKFLIGTELTSNYKGRRTHLLAYGFDENSESIKQLLNLLKDKSWQHTLYRLEYMKDNFNITLSDESYDYMKTKSIIKKPVIAECMKNEGYVQKKGEAIREYIDKVPEKDFSVTPREITYMVHKAGGKVFLAHPFGEECDEIFENNEFDDYINGLIDEGIDGMECYYSAYNNAQIDYLLNVAKEKNLLVSGGSDYHGIKYRSGEIGKITLEERKIEKQDLTILTLFKS